MKVSDEGLRGCKEFCCSRLSFLNFFPWDFSNSGENEIENKVYIQEIIAKFGSKTDTIA